MLTPAAYRKIETGKTKLTVERLYRISEILNASLAEWMEIGNDVLFVGIYSSFLCKMETGAIGYFFQKNPAFPALLRVTDCRLPET
ncbi:MAG: helix-turn-helix domain-containing protein [Tannerella sp.]|nr:helix-turn-helix domain-containing protein [Tannerella sp.]